MKKSVSVWETGYCRYFLGRPLSFIMANGYRFVVKNLFTVGMTPTQKISDNSPARRLMTNG